MRHCTIYALSDPRLPQTFENVRYVGKTKKRLKDRWDGHVYDDKPSYKNNWVISLKRQNLFPVIWPLCFCSEETWQESERFWISKLRPIAKLTNLLAGGNGGHKGPTSIELRKHSRPFPPISPEGRARQRAALLGVPKHPDSIKKSADARRGQKRNLPPFLSEEHKAKIALAHIGKKHTTETKRKMKLAKSKPVLCLDTGITYESITDAGKAIGVTSRTLPLFIKRGWKWGGYRWKILDKCA